MVDEGFEAWMERREAKRQAELFDPKGNLRRRITITLGAEVPQNIKDSIEGVIGETFLEFRQRGDSEEANPSSARCHPFCDNLIRTLESKYGIQASLVRTTERIDLGDAFASGHSYLKIGPNEGGSYIVDPMYLQFVPEDERLGLPDVMVIKTDSESSVNEVLAEHKIPPAIHYIWR